MSRPIVLMCSAIACRIGIKVFVIIIGAIPRGCSGLYFCVGQGASEASSLTIVTNRGRIGQKQKRETG